MLHYPQIAQYLEQGLDVNGINILTDVSIDDINKIKDNVDLENRMQSLGFDRYIERQSNLKKSGQHRDTDTTMILIKKHLKPFAKAIEEFHTNYNSRKPHIAVEVFKKHDAYTLALQTMRICIIAETTERKELAAICVRLSENIEKGLTTPQAYRVGCKLISLMCSVTDASFAIVKVREGTKTIHKIEATEHFYEWEEAQEELLAEMATMFRPMVVPPKPWTGLHSGGYFDSKIQQPFIRNNPKATNKTHGIQAIPKVYEVVNKIQATPFKVNKFVLDVANELAFDDELFFDEWILEVPKRPHNERTKALQATIEECNEILGITPENREVHGKDFGQWVRDMLSMIVDGERYKTKQRLEDARFKMVQYVNWRKDLTSIKSKNRVIKTAVETANDYSSFSSIYFPCNLDWRMRFYPICSGLTTQGTCLQKALIKFSKGKPIGSLEALDWLKIHIANCYGMDKASWQDRLDWTDENTDLIKSVANDPCDMVDEWRDADDPWLFIAACEQMNKYYEDGLDAVVDIPIPMDGTCNGAQHYAAITRDTKGAYGVNVAPNGNQDLQERLDRLRGENRQMSDLGIWGRFTQETNRIFKGFMK